MLPEVRVELWLTGLHDGDSHSVPLVFCWVQSLQSCCKKKPNLPWSTKKRTAPTQIPQTCGVWGNLWGFLKTSQFGDKILKVWIRQEHNLKVKKKVVLIHSSWMDEWLPHPTFLKGPGPEVHQKLCHQVQDLQIEESQLGQQKRRPLLHSCGSGGKSFRNVIGSGKIGGETWMVFFFGAHFV